MICHKEQPRRFDDFDYDTISLDEDPTFDQVSHKKKIVALSHTLKIPTFENITNSNHSFFSNDDFLFDYSSTTSLIPDKIPLGLCSSYLSEENIPELSPHSSMDLILDTTNITDKTVFLDNVWQEDIEHKSFVYNENKRSKHVDNHNKLNKTLSSQGFQRKLLREFSNLEFVNSAPVLSPLKDSLIVNEDISTRHVVMNHEERGRDNERSSNLRISDNSFSKYNRCNLGISGSSMLVTEPHTAGSLEFESDDFNGNWVTRKSDTLRFEDLSVRESGGPSVHDSVHVYFELNCEENTTQRRTKLRKCLQATICLCCTATVCSLMVILWTMIL